MNDPGSFDTKQHAADQSGQNSADASSAQSNQRYSGQPDDLHDLFAVHAAHDGDEEDPLAALRNDPNYAALIRDLEYIAKQARLLFEPAGQEAPSDEVWNKIQRELGGRPPDA
jgi:hypothetical protein